MKEIHYKCDVCGGFINQAIPEDSRNKCRDGFGVDWVYKSPSGADIPEKRMVLIDVSDAKALSHICDRCIRAAVAAIKHFDES